MRLLGVACVLALQHSAEAVAVKAGKLGKALKSNARPVIVHLYDQTPAAVESYAIADVSLACRDAGAVAVLVESALVSAVAEEQDTATGGYPGPLPVIADLALSDLADGTAGKICGESKSAGASAIGIRYYESAWPDASALEEALTAAVAAAEEVGLGALLLGEFAGRSGEFDGSEGTEGAGELAARVGAAAGLARSSGDGSKSAIGCWDGKQDALALLREAGFSALLLKDACRGDVSLGAKQKSPSLAAQGVTKQVKLALSKVNTAIWAGAGSTSGSGSGGSIEDYYARSGDPRDF